VATVLHMGARSLGRQRELLSASGAELPSGSVPGVLWRLVPFCALARVLAPGPRRRCVGARPAGARGQRQELPARGAELRQQRAA